MEKGLEIAANPFALWVSANFDDKRKLQSLVFPDGMLYDKKNDAVRTPQINAVFGQIPLLMQVLAEKKKGNPNGDYLKSCYVPMPSQTSNFLIESLNNILNHL